ncbi:MAG: glycoside hydrolase family 16 protein [Bacteroidales bacterium]|nr:glycoside hydrolase family 16 protein [Bacteroidales bacterium]
MRKQWPVIAGHCLIETLERLNMSLQYHLFFVASIFLMISCEEDDISNTGDPANLEVTVEVADDGSGFVFIQATADYAVEYQLRIGNDNEPVETNITGTFEYQFIQPGTYELDVRAYGSSGRYLRRVIPVTIVIGGQDVTPDQGYTTPLHYDGWELVWHDEFEGSSIDTGNWVFEIGDGCPNLCGWGNNELQYYREQNAWVEEGILTIEARKENFGGRHYTSARMKTQGKQSFQYGRIDIRALLPAGQGIWPALWMLGNDITSAGWPKCGEIDIMEMIGGNGRENTVHGTVHWDLNGHVEAGGSYTLPEGTFGDEYHVFSIIWNAHSITWFVNDIQYYQIDITPNHMTEFHQEFFFIFNVAVGGNWPGNPNETTVFPQQMRVDYVRVFQER